MIESKQLTEIYNIIVRYDIVRIIQYTNILPQSEPLLVSDVITKMCVMNSHLNVWAIN